MHLKGMKTNMKKLYIILLCALQSICGMDDYSAPVIVLDVELISDETPKDQSFASVLASVSHAPAIKRAFSFLEIPKLIFYQQSIIDHSKDLRKTMHGATNIINSALEKVKLSPNEKKVKTLLDIGLTPEIKPAGIKLIKILTANNVPLMLATHHDVYHLQKYAAYLKKYHDITLKDFFSHGAIVVADPYDSKHEGNAPLHTIVEEPRPSEKYASAIKALAADKPVMLFDTNAQIVAEYSSNKTLLAYHATTAADVERILQEQGYILDAISLNE